MRLVDVGGNAAQDLGLGRIVGQIVVYLYLSEAERSLDQIGEELKLSKAAVSIAARQLEALGILRRVWKPGDRKSYYRTADDIGTALQGGLLVFVRQKMQTMAKELDYVHEALAKTVKKPEADRDAQFLFSRVKRAKSLHGRAAKLLQSRLLRVFMR